MSRTAVALIFFALICSCATPGGYAQERTERPTRSVTVATSPDYPPLTFIDKDGELSGFDIDFIRAVAAEAGLSLTFVYRSFYDLTSGLRAGDYDVVISGITLVRGRSDDLVFTDPYFHCEQIFLSRTGNTPPTSLNDLHGARIGVIATGEKLLQPLVPEHGFELVPIGPYPALYSALVSGEVDAILVDYIYAYIIANDPEYRDTVAILDEPVGSDPFGMIVRAEDTELLALLNRGIRAVQERGIDEELLSRWF